MTLPTIAFDGDDTLWHSETQFAGTQARLREILAAHVSAETIDRTLLARERANLALFGYGVKGFVLSMIETAIEVSNSTVTASEIQELIDMGKAMLSSPVEPIDGVDEVVEGLKRRGHRLMVITKGDLFHQESKIARSGLADQFDAVEIVSEKDETTYRDILDRHGIDPNAFVMVGNSIRSDILPVLAMGSHAIHVPYVITWTVEQAGDNADLPPILKAESIADVPEMIAAL
ncbi:MAG: HAD family hydrolase [Pseudomonadota bacterium]